MQKIPIELESFCSFNAIQGTSSDYDNFQTHMLNNANNNWSKITKKRTYVLKHLEMKIWLTIVASMGLLNPLPSGRSMKVTSHAK